MSEEVFVTKTSKYKLKDCKESLENGEKYLKCKMENLNKEETK